MLHLSWADRSLTFLHDAARSLALVHQGQLHLDPDGGLSASSLEVWAQHTCMKQVAPPPRHEQASPYHSFLFRLLGYAGLIGAAADRVLLSTAAYEWVGQPPELQLAHLRQAWFLAPEVGWYWLPANSRRPHLNSRWETATMKAIRATTELSTTEWIPACDLMARLESDGTLALGTTVYNLPKIRRAMEQHAQRLLTFLLQEILPCLGLLEVQGQEESVCLRPTPEGASWLNVALSQRHYLALPPDDTAVERGVPSHELRFPPRAEPAIVVHDDLSLIVHPGAPAACTFEVAHFAQLLTPAPSPPDGEQAATRYQVTLESQQRAMAWDYTARQGDKGTWRQVSA